MHHIPYPALALYEVNRSNSSSLQESWRVSRVRAYGEASGSSELSCRSLNYAQSRQVLIQRFPVWMRRYWYILSMGMSGTLTCEF